MKNTKNNDQLSPEIRKQAEKLFSLIEAEIEKSDEDTVCEAIAEEMGDFLKNSKGYNNLEFSCLLAKTRREQAHMDLETASWNMNDNALNTLTELYQDVLSASQCFDNNDIHFFKSFFENAVKEAKEVKGYLSHTWQDRAISYGKELKAVAV
jgi:hypothetical protein